MSKDLDDPVQSDQYAARLRPLGLDDPMLSNHERQALVEAVEYLKPIRVLSLDGGGIRGIYQAQVIRRIMDELRRELSNNALQVTDVFDLIAGTSTGGIIAAGLTTVSGRMAEGRDRPAALVDLYQQLAAEVFPQNLRLWRGVRRALVGKYRATALEHLLEQQLGDGKLSSPQRRILIPAYGIDDERTHWFDSSPRFPSGSDPLLRAVIRATSAAPTYFPAARVAGRRYVDGGVGANNPTLKATAIALQQWADNRRKLYTDARRMAVRLPAKVVVISIGNGSDAPASPRFNGVFGWGAKVGNLFGHSSGTAATELAASLPSALEEYDINNRPFPVLRYLRIEPSAETTPALDDARPETLERLLAAADATSERRGKHTQFEQAIHALVKAHAQ
jgi:hypothetical protein